MYISRRLLLPVLVVSLLAVSVVSALGANADRVPAAARADFFSSRLAPSLPVPTDPTIHGVAPGGAPWALKEGSVVLRKDGHIRVGIEKLVLTIPPFVGKPGPVTGVAASLYCGADTNTTPAATTGVEPLSDGGNASINTTITLPSSCLAPIVLVHPVIASTLNMSIYIAVTGFAG